MIDPRAARAFLDDHRIAVVGGSDDPKGFGGTVFRALLEHGSDAVAVNPAHDTVADRPCYHTLAEVPGELENVLVMVPAGAAVDVVHAAAERGVRRVWLFKGLGGPGALSPEAVAACDDHGMEVIAGACPLMFLEPVGRVHKLHRSLRRLNHSVAKAA